MDRFRRGDSAGDQGRLPPVAAGIEGGCPPAAQNPADGAFQLIRSDVLGDGAVPTPALVALVDYWAALSDEGLPSLRDVDPTRAQVLPGRVHLVRVEPAGRFRFLHYGATVTNPDARSMQGLTTTDYEDAAFGALVTAHYAESVQSARPICRRVQATWRGKPYDYVRVVAPFGLDGDRVDYLIVATERSAVPDELARQESPADPAVIRSGVERMYRLSRQVADDEAAIAMAGLAAAAAMHFAEATLLETHGEPARSP